MIVPLWWDTKRAYRIRDSIAANLEKMLASDKVDKDSFAKILEKLEKSPEGIPSLGRLVMTLGVVAVVGIALFHVLVFSSTFYGIDVNSPNPPSNQTLALVKDLKTQQNDMAKTLITILGGAVSAIIGFYFGSKSSSDASKTSSSGSGGTRGTAGGTGGTAGGTGGTDA